MWTCPKCGAKVDPSFEVCWSCGTTPDGVEDPSFVRADDAPPITDPPVVPTLDVAGPAGSNPLAELPEPPAGDLVECHWTSSLAEAQLLADQLTGDGIPALARDANYFGRNLTSFNLKDRCYLLVRADDLPRARAWLQAHGHQGDVEAGRGPASDEVVACYQALDLMEARFLADQLTQQGIPATADTEDMHAELGSMSSSPRVWVRADDLPRARGWLEAYDRQHKGGGASTD